MSLKGLLDEVRALRIPVDFIEIFDWAHVPYYEGSVEPLLFGVKAHT